LTVNTAAHRIDEQDFTLTSTLDAQVNPNARYSLYLLDSNRKPERGDELGVIAKNVYVPALDPPVMTWGALQLLGAMRSPWRDVNAPTRTEMQQYVQQQIGIIIASYPLASATVRGLTKLSAVPASSGNPVAVGDNDTRLPTARGAATLAAGQAVVLTPFVTADSLVQLTAQDDLTIGTLRVSARMPGAGFTISSSDGADRGLVAWEIKEPTQ
jgi:hypothetical protein